MTTEPAMEIGGYIQLDRYSLPMLHEGAVALNCGRNCLRWLAEKKQIRRLLLPAFLCNTAWEACEGVSLRFYGVGADLLPMLPEPEVDEWIYLVNYYGQLDASVIADLVARYHRVIVDNTQGYFDAPVDGAYTIYSCRKYFGVPDGAFLVSADPAIRVGYEDLPLSSSCEHMHFLLGRVEHGANAYYAEYTENNKRFHHAPIERMSPLTENLLHAIDYDAARQRRTENFNHLSARLHSRNRLSLRAADGAFAYPLWLPDGAEVRKKLIAQKIYVPQLWPNVVETMAEDTPEYDLARNILPLPCDQRYGAAEMERICEALDV